MIKLLIVDVDGVMTNGKKYFARDGEVVAKGFCDKDWTAIKRFKSIGVDVVLLTGDAYNAWILDKRAIDVVVNRGDGKHRDKALYLSEICDRFCVRIEQIAYVGDDFYDISIMKLVGYAYCPKDSIDMVKHCENVRILGYNGGDNFLSHLFEHLESCGLIPRKSYDEISVKMYELDEKEVF